MPKASTHPLSHVPSGVWVLGFVSMLMDISSEMIHSLLPLFMVTTLGSSAAAVGLVEGLAESTALVVKVFSGALSDYVGKRKGLTALGYALGAITKPLFALASTTGVIQLQCFASSTTGAIQILNGSYIRAIRIG